MRSKIATERLYSLGNYSNIKFSSEISELPDEAVLNPEVIPTLRFLQLIDCELAYNRYIELVESFVGKERGEIIAQLETHKQTTYDELFKHIIKEQQENTEKE